MEKKRSAVPAAVQSQLDAQLKELQELREKLSSRKFLKSEARRLKEMAAVPKEPAVDESAPTTAGGQAGTADSVTEVWIGDTDDDEAMDTSCETAVSSAESPDAKRTKVVVKKK